MKEYKGTLSNFQNQSEPFWNIPFWFLQGCFQNLSLFDLYAPYWTVYYL